jgi:hypothetical protein
MTDDSAKVQALLVFTGFVAIPYSVITPVLTYYAACSAYRYVCTHSEYTEHSMAKKGNQQLSKGDRKKAEDRKIRKYWKMMNDRQLVGDLKPIMKGEVVGYKVSYFSEDNFTKFARVAKVHDDGERFDIILCEEDPKNPGVFKYVDVKQKIGSNTNAKLREGSVETSIILGVERELLQQRSSHDPINVTLQKALVSLIQPFEVGFYWFKSYVLVEKLLLATITVLVHQNLDLQFGLTLALCGLGAMSSLVCNPFLAPTEDHVDMAQRVANFLIAVVAYLIHRKVVDTTVGNVLLFAIVIAVFLHAAISFDLVGQVNDMRGSYNALVLHRHLKEKYQNGGKSAFTLQSSRKLDTPEAAAKKAAKSKQWIARVIGRIQPTQIRRWTAVDKALLVLEYDELISRALRDGSMLETVPNATNRVVGRELDAKAAQLFKCAKQKSVHVNRKQKTVRLGSRQQTVRQPPHKDTSAPAELPGDTDAEQTLANEAWRKKVLMALTSLCSYSSDEDQRRVLDLKTPSTDRLLREQVMPLLLRAEELGEDDDEDCVDAVDAVEGTSRVGAKVEASKDTEPTELYDGGKQAGALADFRKKLNSAKSKTDLLELDHLWDQSSESGLSFMSSKYSVGFRKRVTALVAELVSTSFTTGANKKYDLVFMPSWLTGAVDAKGLEGHENIPRSLTENLSICSVLSAKDYFELERQYDECGEVNLEAASDGSPTQVDLANIEAAKKLWRSVLLYLFQSKGTGLTRLFLPKRTLEVAEFFSALLQESSLQAELTKAQGLASPKRKKDLMVLHLGAWMTRADYSSYVVKLGELRDKSSITNGGIKEIIASLDKDGSNVPEPTTVGCTINFSQVGTDGAGVQLGAVLGNDLSVVELAEGGQVVNQGVELGDVLVKIGSTSASDRSEAVQMILAAKGRAEAHFQLEFTREGPPSFPELAVVAVPKSDSPVYNEMLLLRKAEATVFGSTSDVRELKFRLAEFPALKTKNGAFRLENFLQRDPAVDAGIELPQADYSNMDSTKGLIDHPIESFEMKDVATGTHTWKSHLLLGHQNFTDRPSCYCFYATW